jgi:hypothetical protein
MGRPILPFLNFDGLYCPDPEGIRRARGGLHFLAGWLTPTPDTIAFFREELQMAHFDNPRRLGESLRKQVYFDEFASLIPQICDAHFRQAPKKILGLKLGQDGWKPLDKISSSRSRELYDFVDEFLRSYNKETRWDNDALILYLADLVNGPLMEMSAADTKLSLQVQRAFAGVLSSSASNRALAKRLLFELSHNPRLSDHGRSFIVSHYCWQQLSDGASVSDVRAELAGILTDDKPLTCEQAERQFAPDLEKFEKDAAKRELKIQNAKRRRAQQRS